MSLIPHAFLFHTRQPVRRLGTSGKRKPALAPLAEEFRLRDAGELDGRPPFARLYAAWHPRGMMFTVSVSGKQQPLQCDIAKLLASDGLQLWIDTRNTPGVHRANRFCHQLIALPAGAGKNGGQAHIQQVEIARAREASPLAGPDDLTAASKLSSDGYTLNIWVSAAALNGYDPEHSPQLGFFYAVQDAELGEQTSSVGREFPFASDPSLWQTLELVE